MTKSELNAIINEVIYTPTAGEKPEQQKGILECLYENGVETIVPYNTITKYLWNRKLVKKRGRERYSLFLARCRRNLNEQKRSINEKFFKSPYKYSIYIKTLTTRGLTLITKRDEIIRLTKKEGSDIDKLIELKEKEISATIQRTESVSSEHFLSKDKNNAWIEIDLDNLLSNFETVKKTVGGGKNMLIDLRADAFGHGSEQVSRIFNEDGADLFGVENIEEVISLRQNGIKLPILVYDTLPFEQIKDITKKYNDIIFTIPVTNLNKLSEFLSDIDKKISVCIQIGGGVYQVLTDQINQIFKDIIKIKELSIQCIYMALPFIEENSNGTDYKDKKYSKKRIYELMGFDVSEAVQKIKELKLDIPFKCTTNIKILHKFSDFFNTLDTGYKIYGMDDSLKNLHSAFSFKSLLTRIYRTPPVKYFSLGKIYYTKPQMIGELSVGYAHGYSSILSYRSQVLINNKRVPIIGRIKMFKSYVDIAPIPNAKPSTEVILIGKGKDKEITLKEISDFTGMRQNEFICSIIYNKLVNRRYI